MQNVARPCCGSLLTGHMYCTRCLHSNDVQGQPRPDGHPGAWPHERPIGTYIHNVLYGPRESDCVRRLALYLLFTCQHLALHNAQIVQREVQPPAPLPIAHHHRCVFHLSKWPATSPKRRPQ